MEYSTDFITRSSKDPGAKMEDDPPSIRFVNDTVEDRAKSISTGRYYHAPCIKVFVRAKGDQKSEVPYIAEKTVGDKVTSPWMLHLQHRLHHGQISDRYYEYCKESLDHFKANEELPIDGTPVKTWNGADQAMIRNAIDLGLRTVEDVAKMDESTMQALGMGARAMKTRAETFVSTGGNASRAEGQIVDLKAKLELSDRRASEQAEQMSALARKLADLENAPKRGPGRPPKVAVS